MKPLDWRSAQRLDFEPPDTERFPSLALARASLRTGGGAPAVLNAANEIAVEAFLNERIRFGEIFGTVESTLTQLSQQAANTPSSVDELLEIDRQAREIAQAHVAKIAG